MNSYRQLAKHLLGYVLPSEPHTTSGCADWQEQKSVWHFPLYIIGIRL